MRIALLGPLRVHDDSDVRVDLPGVRLRALLVRLALEPDRLVGADALIDAVWGDRPPAGARHALHSLVFRLRQALPSALAGCLDSSDAGYRLRVPPDTVDLGRFERVAAEGRAARDAGDLRTAGRLFAEALGLWRGTPLTELRGGELAVAFGARLAELWLRTAEDRAEVELIIGEPGELVTELGELVAAHPLRERLRALHMRALYAAGRSAEALASYAEVRRTLANALGTDPSPALRDLHTAILRGDVAPVPSRGRADAGPRTNLRTPFTSFVGREDELDRVDRLLDGARLVTLVGPGGVGKTRLATEAAARWTERFRDGVWLVELAGLGDPTEIPAAIFAALALREVGLLPTERAGAGAAAERAPVGEHGVAAERGPAGEHGVADAGARPHSPVERLVEALREWQVLIVLDNCEHLVEECARVADGVLGRCPQVRILATSREPLALTGETLCPVGPLPVPAVVVDAEQAPEFPALRLFAHRAAALRPGFTLTAGNLPAVTEVCRRLDGLPLAIELACARLRTLPVEELAARLEDRFRLLTSGSRTALPRHRTLLAVVEWSWDLFSVAERRLARRLAVFAGGATTESAEAVCAGDGLAASDVLHLLGALVDKSFVQLWEAPGVPPRYRMLDTIAAYAGGELTAAGEADRARAAHARYFLARAEEAEPALRGPDQLTWLAWLGREYTNLASALRWAIDSGDAATALRFTVALGWFWMLRANHGEAASWLRETLVLPGAAVVWPDGPTAGRPEADASHPGAAWRSSLSIAYAYDSLVHFAIDDVDRANRSAETARHLTGDARKASHPAPVMTDIILKMQQFEVAAAMARLAELADHPDPWIGAAAELSWGHAAEHFGDAIAGSRHFAAAHDRFGALGDRWGVATAIGALGGSLSLGGDHATAIEAMAEAARLAEAIGAQDDAARMRIWRGRELARAGDTEGARAELARVRTTGYVRRSALVLSFAETALGDLARLTGDLGEARSLLTEVLRRLDDTDPLPPQLRARTLTALGALEVAAGSPASARDCLREALDLGLTTGDRPIIANVADALAESALADGQPSEAARLLGLAAAARGAPDLGSPDVRRAEAAARAALGDGYDPAYAAAASLGADDAVAALRGCLVDLLPDGGGRERSPGES